MTLGTIPLFVERGAYISLWKKKQQLITGRKEFAA